MDQTSPKCDVDAVARIVTKHIAPQLLDVSGKDLHGRGPDGGDEVPILILPTGLKAESVKKYVDEYRTAPERREGTAHLVEIASLIDHVNRFKDEDSALFASPSATQPTLTAVLDYHRRCHVPDPQEEKLGRAPIVPVDRAVDVPVPTKHVEGAPRFGKHRAVYPFPLSDEWKAWKEANGKPMDQATFAVWIEDRIIDVADPDSAFAAATRFAEALGVSQFASPSRLLGLSRGLTIHEAARVTNKIDPATGETTMLYEAQHQDDAGGSLSVPRAFLIRIPVFRAGAIYQLPVRLKYRVGHGKVVWFYEVHDAAKAFDDAFREACESAAEKTSLPLFYGSPE